MCECVSAPRASQHRGEKTPTPGRVPPDLSVFHTPVRGTDDAPLRSSPACVKKFRGQTVTGEETRRGAFKDRRPAGDASFFLLSLYVCVCALLTRTFVACLRLRCPPSLVPPSLPVGPGMLNET